MGSAREEFKCLRRGCAFGCGSIWVSFPHPKLFWCEVQPWNSTREPTGSPGPSFPPAVFMLWPVLAALGATELLLMSPVGQQVPCASLRGGRRTCCFSFCPDPRWQLIRHWLTVQSFFWAGAGVGPPELQVGLHPVSCCLFPFEGSVLVPWLFVTVTFFGLLCW